MLIKNSFTTSSGRPHLRSTFSLSVSVSYLDLEEVYLPFNIGFPTNATLELKTIYICPPNYYMSFYRAFTFFGVVFQLNFKNSIIVMEAFSFPHFHITQKEHQITKKHIFSTTSFPLILFFLDLRSPLLIQSHLISFHTA